MVIINTNKDEVSIQAVSPEFNSSAAKAGVARLQKTAAIAAIAAAVVAAVEAIVATLLGRRNVRDICILLNGLDLKGIGTALSGANADSRGKIPGKKLAVADLAGLRCVDDRLDDPVSQIIIDRQFQF